MGAHWVSVQVRHSSKVGPAQRWQGVSGCAAPSATKPSSTGQTVGVGAPMGSSAALATPRSKTPSAVCTSAWSKAAARRSTPVSGGAAGAQQRR